ncbi:MAG: hypothetical protein QM719_12815 [Thermomonas sp.]
MKNAAGKSATIVSCLCLVVSLAGCSGHDDHQGTMAAEATPLVAEPVSTQVPEAAAPGTVINPAPTQEQASGPLPAVSNEPDQAGPAAQAEAELDIPVEAPGADSSPATPASTQATATTKAHAVATIGPQLAAATHVAPQTQQALPTHYTKAQRAQRFRQVAMQLKAPVLLADTGKPGRAMYSLKLGNIGLSNLDSSVLVHFAMKSMDAEWRNEALAAGNTQEFECGFPQQCLFWMRTGTKPAVFYAMHTPQRYAIVWDGEQGLWDLRLVENAGPGE